MLSGRILYSKTKKYAKKKIAKLLVQQAATVSGAIKFKIPLLLLFTVIYSFLEMGFVLLKSPWS